MAGLASAQAINATVNGDRVDFVDVQPRMLNNRVMVPVRGVFEHMKVTLEWDANSRSVLAKRGTNDIQLPIGQYNAIVNGDPFRMDTPASIINGRTMVPLRFLSEALGATVEWIAASRTVEINVAGAGAYDTAGYTVIRMEPGTVIPFKLSQRLTSKESIVDDTFKARLDTGGGLDYQGMEAGGILEGHVSVAKAKEGNTPGVLGLAFDRILLADGTKVPIYGTLIGLDNKSVETKEGRIVAKAGAKNDNLKYIGYGAGGGAIVALLTKGNVITTSLIGGALGWIFGETQKNPEKARDVVLESGSKFGVRLTRMLVFRVPTMSK